MYDDGHGDVDREPLNRLYFDVSSIRSDCISLSSLFGFRFGRFIVFSMVFANSARRQRENVVAVVDGHRFGEVALVTTVTSIISTLDSDCDSLESLPVVVVAVSFVGELSAEDIFLGFSSLSVFWRYLPPTSLPFKYETAGLVEFNDDRLLKLFTCSLFEVRGYSLL